MILKICYHIIVSVQLINNTLSGSNKKCNTLCG